MSTTVTAAAQRLYLVPAPLDFGAEAVALSETLPDATLRTAAGLTHWICENAKSLRAYLQRVHALHPLVRPLREMHIVELPREVHKKGDHGGTFDAQPLLQGLLASGEEPTAVGLASEAGMPAIADPGSSVVRAAHDLGLEVVPLAGPVSLTLALAASGLSGQHFCFIGYLPQDVSARARRIQDLEGEARRTGQTQIFIETPYRNAALLQTLLSTLGPRTRLAICAGLSLPSARTRSAVASQWRQGGWAPDNHTPAVFLIGP